MLLLVSTALCLGMAVFVALKAQERRVKFWLAFLCVSAAALCAGLWVEVNIEPWTFTAARINMTAGLCLAAAGLLSARVMCGLPFHLPVILILAAGSLVNLATVWLTDAYFTGEVVRYPWGIYVAGDPKFISNPLLVAIIAMYGLVNLAMHYKRAHPLDKNRTKYLFLAYFFLSFGLLDYVPHFGIDLFGGPISGISTPLFLSTFAYAMLRYRLLDFRALVGRGTGWLLTVAVMVLVYALFVEGAERWLNAPSAQAHVAAAVSVFLIWITMGRVLPAWSQRLLANQEPDFQRIVRTFSAEITSVLNETVLREKTTALCAGTFGSTVVAFREPGQIQQSPLLQEAASAGGVVEAEVLRRERAIQDATEDEVIIPLRRDEQLLGVITLGRKIDGGMYSDQALDALKFMGSICTIALANARSATELEKRHQLDRYLAPQIVERVLSGDAAVIESKRRMMVTIFFSDLKGFTELADKMDPETLSHVLNEYLSEMAELAFQFGGTVDKFIGDAVMVFFGAPVIDVAAANQAQQCVRMAAAMHARTAALNERWRTEGRLNAGLVCRMGIHTGEATVGSFGSSNRLEYTAIGRTVNLASRLEGQCTPGKILVSDETWKLLENKFPGTSRGKIRVKGFAEEVEVFEIEPS